MKITKSYSKPFVADPSKLTRLVSVVDEEFRARKGKCSRRFTVGFSNGKTYETDSHEEVFRLDNPLKNPVKNLQMCWISAAREDATFVTFSGGTPVAVELDVQGADSKWAAEVMAAAEEQVERTLQTNTWARLRAKPDSFLLASFLPMLIAVLAALLSVLAYKAPLASTMWLKADDLTYLSMVSQNPAASAHDLTAEVTARQVRNIIGQHQKSSLPSRLISWRSLFVLAVVLAVVATVGYLFRYCYPAAVFAWGDYAEAYESLVRRRRMIWSVLIGSLLVGIVANLFVLGLTSAGTR